MQISYNRPNYGWINEQYIGTSFTDSEWVKDYRWEKVVKFDFINGFNNFYSFLNYGIYNNSESKEGYYAEQCKEVKEKYQSY